MQSGIQASQELADEFKKLVTNPSRRGLIATISGEEIKPAATLNVESDFDADLSQLDSLLVDNAAAYIILRRFPESDNGFIAVTYVPDAAPVRQKMLFASTRLTLVRELGIERFRETIFATTKAELTKEGFKKHDDHVKLDAPLTEEEQTLGEVKRLEAEGGIGMQAKRSHVQGSAGFPVEEEALQALKDLGESTGGKNLVQLKIDIPRETIVLHSFTESSPSALATDISSNEARYSFFKYRHTHNGQDLAPIVFIYSCPGSSKVNERMVYAVSRRAVVSKAESDAGLTVDKRLEVSDPDEITADGLETEFHPKVETKRAFERPKRPGRR